VRKLGISGQGDVGDCRQTDCVTLEGALSRAINGILEGLRATRGSLAQYVTASRTVYPRGFLAICFGSGANKEEPISWDCLSTTVLARLYRQDWLIIAPSLNR
jgi:hypothetical protein